MSKKMKLIYTLVSGSIAFILCKNENLFQLTPPYLFLLGVLFIVSQVFRYIRFWIIMSYQGNRNIGYFALPFYFGTTLSLATIPILKDIYIFILVLFQNKHVKKRAIFGLLFNRFFDFFMIAPFLLYWGIYKENKDILNSSIVYFLIALLLLTFFYLFPRLNIELINYLIRYTRGKTSLLLLKSSKENQTVISRMKIFKRDIFILAGFLTLLAWVVELIGILLLDNWLDNHQVLNLYSGEVFNLFSNKVGNIFIKNTFLFNLFLNPLFLFSIVYFGFKFLKGEKNDLSNYK